MSKARVHQQLPFPAHKLWALVANFGNVGWMPGVGDAVEVQGEGPGMQRIIHAGEQRICEQLESSDDTVRTLVYRITEGVPFPVRDYRATMIVHERGADACELDWRCSFEPEGASEEQAQQMIEGLYNTMIGWIRDYLASQTERAKRAAAETV